MLYVICYMLMLFLLPLETWNDTGEASFNTSAAIASLVDAGEVDVVLLSGVVRWKERKKDHTQRSS